MKIMIIKGEHWNEVYCTETGTKFYVQMLEWNHEIEQYESAFGEFFGPMRGLPLWDENADIRLVVDEETQVTDALNLMMTWQMYRLWQYDNSNKVFKEEKTKHLKDTRKNRTRVLKMTWAQ